MQGYKDEQWLQALFNKYSQYIQHLKVYHRDIFRFVGRSEDAIHLEKLEVFRFDGNITDKEKADHEYNVYHGVGASSLDNCEEPGFGGVYLAPLFEGVFTAADSRCGSLTTQKRDWFAIQNFWLLLMTNPKLKHVKFHRNLLGLARIDQVSVLYSKFLSEVKALELLDDGSYSGTLATLLENLPTVKHLRLEFIDLPPHHTAPLLHVSYPHLETIVMASSLYILQLFNILRHLPNLTYLRLEAVCTEKDEYWDDELQEFVVGGNEPLGLEEAKEILGGGPHVHLKKFELVYRGKFDYEKYETLFPGVPFLITSLYGF
ncbi:hypothetical protein FBU30_004576 [Linnemannia zychae]|nr:hypothetical protein FBU30_004576 [Linnemannia zychae]